MFPQTANLEAKGWTEMGGARVPKSSLGGLPGLPWVCEGDKFTCCLQPLRFWIFLFQKLAQVVGVSGTQLMTGAAVSRSWSPGA